MSAPARSALYQGRVWHRRFRPREHQLGYRMVMVLLDLDELPQLKERLRLFSTGRFNVMDFRARDHLDGRSEDLKFAVETVLADGGFETGGRIRVLCMPRLLGAVFNPLTVYFCETSKGRLQTILYEVNNTFGQRHVYLLAADPAEGQVEHGCEKVFYVSPFNPIEMSYAFSITPPGEFEDERPLSVRIDVRDPQGLVMTAALTGVREPLSDQTILEAWFRHPLLAAKVLGAIHWEALKLWLKGVKLVERPPPPAEPVSFVLTKDSSPLAAARR